MYLNRAEKETITCLAGCVGFAETLLKEKWYQRGKFKKQAMLKRCLEVIQRNADKAIQIMMECVEPEQRECVIATADGLKIAVVPKHSPRAEDVYQPVRVDALRRIVSTACGECLFCEKNEREQKKCQMRKDLLLCATNVEIGQENSDGCPFVGMSAE